MKQNPLSFLLSNSRTPKYINPPKTPFKTNRDLCTKYNLVIHRLLVSHKCLETICSLPSSDCFT